MSAPRTPAAPRSRPAALARALAAAAALAAAFGTAPAALAQAKPAEPDVADQLFKLQKDSARILDRLAAIEKASAAPRPQADACAEVAARSEGLDRRLRVIEEQLLATQRRLDEAIAELRAGRRSALPAPGPGAVPGASAVSGPAPGAASPSPAGAEAAPAAAPPPASTTEVTPSGGARASLPAPAAAAPAAAESVTELFHAAYRDYSGGNYDLARTGFESVLKADPAGPLADDAQLWIGESLYAKGQYAEAATAFEKVVSGWPGGDKEPLARLKRGFALFEGRRTADGVAELQKVMSGWPDSNEAKLAREFLKRKGAL